MKAIARFLKTALVLTVIGIGGAIAYAYSGFYDVSVGTGHNPVTHWFLATLRDNAIERRAAELEVPPLEDDEKARAGAMAYNQACAGCHGRPGRPPSDSFDPRPPALTRYDYDPAEVFWVVRNGIKMSAMPARSEDRMSDEEVWQVAAFLQTAHMLTEGEYREMVEPPPEPEPIPEPADGDNTEQAEGVDEQSAEEDASAEPDDEQTGPEDESDG